jgi:SsrA-binding protein
MEEKVICLNRSATHEYFILDRLEAGIVLEGSEVKSLRLGNANLKDCFCVIHNGELILKNMHIALYDKAGAFNSKNSRRDRKLLLHKNEILKVGAKISQKGLTLVPLKVYLKGALMKLELGVCQGKHTYDKKRVKQEKDLEREKLREIKNFR